MVDYSEDFIGLDVSKDGHAVAAQGGGDGEVRFFGEIASDAATVRRFVRKLKRHGARLRLAPRRPPAARRASTVFPETLFGPILADRTPGRDARLQRRQHRA